MTQKAQKISILLVEDEPLIALDAAYEIEDEGFDCVVVYDLANAIRILMSENVDAALLDYDLGTTNSLPLAKLLEYAERPFAFVSGRANSDLLREVGNGVPVFSKPANYGEIARTLLN